ncbi:hypothetical protein A2317_03370 [Candidatus Uhrbacteria bacterium RIFOXYB2_FULL_41_10]|nr:MAG: hypothetical protein A2317_03370 [Candidatus Uhrbacteria bacterium RIFOXYB2_FULL_41_10]
MTTCQIPKIGLDFAKISHFLTNIPAFYLKTGVWGGGHSPLDPLWPKSKMEKTKIKFFLSHSPQGDQKENMHIAQQSAVRHGGLTTSLPYHHDRIADGYCVTYTFFFFFVEGECNYIDFYKQKRTNKNEQKQTKTNAGKTNEIMLKY